MVPYYFLVFAPMLLALLRNNGVIRIGNSDWDRNRNAVISLFFWIFLGMLMLRGRACGSDTGRYIVRFLTIKSETWKSVLFSGKYEIGYGLLNKLISLFTSEGQALLIVTAFLMIWPVYCFYMEESENAALTVILFLTIAPFSMYFSGMRQAIAMAAAFPAWRSAQEKKWIRFTLIVLLAMQFHKSAFILFALYPLCHVKITTQWLLLVVPAMVAVYVFNKPIFNFLSELLWEDYGQAGNTGATTVLLLLVILSIYAFVIPDAEQLDQKIVGYRNVLLLTVVLQCFAPVHSLAMRMNYYFLPFIPILIPKIANRSKAGLQNVTNISVVVMVLFFTVYFFWRAYTGADPLSIYPYVPFWKN